MAFFHTVGFVALLVSVECLTRDQMFDYGLQFGDQILDMGSDSVLELELDHALFFFKRKFDTVYVSDLVHQIISCFIFFKHFEIFLRFEFN